MSTDCSIYNCNTNEKGSVVTQDDRDHIAKHDWKLKLNFDGVTLCDIERKFELNTKYGLTTTIGKLTKVSGDITACNQVNTGTLNGNITESIKGFSTTILYADLENKMYLIKKNVEEHKFTSRQQNPFVFWGGYNSQNSIAYFLYGTRTKYTEYVLTINGVVVWSKETESAEFKYEPQPIVWPLPSHKASFYTGAEEYKWLNETYFYNYNDPSDVGFSPCYTGPITGDGVGMLYGYQRALDDGGKDFFYPKWVRDYAFNESWIHELWKQEATYRFTNRLGGQISTTCAKGFETDYMITPAISSAIYGNYVHIGDSDFWSFYLPELKETVNKLGNDEIKTRFDKAIDGENYYHDLSNRVYYPIGVV